MVDTSVSMRCRCFAALLFLSAAGCDAEEPGHQLRVDLITDFVPAREFDAVRVSIGEGDIRDRFDHIVDPSRDYIRGVALGNMRVSVGEQPIEVDLFRDGVLIIARRVSVSVQGGVTIATVVITRDCDGVMCPGLGNPLLASCLGGQCSDPRCTVESPEFCPPGTCFEDTDCPSNVCAQPICVTGACLYDPDDTACDEGQRCDLDLGCVEGEFDAGVRDAGTPDVSMEPDAGPDVFITPDAFVMPDVVVPPDVPADVFDAGFDAGPPPGCASPDDDTLFLYDFIGTMDLVSGYAGNTRDGAGVTLGDSPCGPQMLVTPGPLVSRFVVPDQASFRVDEGSLDFWVQRPTELTGGSVGLVSRDEMDINTEGQLTLFFTRDEKLALRGQISNSVSVLLCSEASVPVNEWMRIGINWGPGGLELYLNGVLQMAAGSVRLFDDTEHPCSVATIPFSIAPTQDPFVLGASSYRSDPASDEPALQPGPGWQYDHFRLSRVRRDYATEL